MHHDSSEWSCYASVSLCRSRIEFPSPTASQPVGYSRVVDIARAELNLEETAGWVMLKMQQPRASRNLLSRARIRS